MVKPKYFPRLKAWYYRNYVYKSILHEILFDAYKPQLFETLYTTNGVSATYLGKNKFVEHNRRSEIFNKEVNTNQIPFIQFVNE